MFKRKLPLNGYPGYYVNSAKKVVNAQGRFVIDPRRIEYHKQLLLKANRELELLKQRFRGTTKNLVAKKQVYRNNIKKHLILLLKVQLFLKRSRAYQ